MSIWSENLAVVRTRFPEAAQRIERAASRTGAQSSAIPNERRRQLAQRWLGERTWADGAMLALSGLSDGWHVRALLEALPRRAWVFVAEAEPGNARAVLETLDLRDALADPRLSLGVGAVDEAFFASLAQAPILEIGDVQAVVYAPAYNAAPAYYARFFTEFARQIDFRRKLLGTAVVDAALWQANTFENLAALEGAPDLAALRDAFRGRTMVLVSAGPSLDESLDFVREVSARALVVAVNSSYRAVRRAGIVPPLVLAADPREFTARGFADVQLDGTWLVTTHIVNPDVVRLFDGRVFTWSGNNPLVEELRARCGLPPGTTLVEQGTVSACAIDLAAVLGCERICLVGQDLAVRADGRSHASDSFYTDLNANRVDLAACRWLPGNTIDQVPVEGKLYVYLKTFEQLVTQRPRLQFLNTARLGARIAGAPYADFASAEQWIGEMPPLDAAAILSERFQAGRGQALDAARVRAALGSTLAFAPAVLAAAIRAAAALEQLPERYVAENYRNAPAVAAALRAEQELRELLRRHPRDYAILEAGRTRLELYRAREAQIAAEGQAEHWRRVVAAREFAWAIAEGAWFLHTALRRFAPSPAGAKPNVKAS